MTLDPKLNELGYDCLYRHSCGECTLLVQLLAGTIFSDLSSTFVFWVLNLAILNSTEQ